MAKDSKGRKLKTKESQMPDGRYRYRYTDKFGNTHAIYSWKLVPTDKIPSGKKDDLSLREKIIKIERDLQDQIDVSSSTNMSVNQLIELYLSTKTQITNSTKVNYIHIWEKNIKYTPFGKMKIPKVKKSDVLKFYAYLYKVKGFAVGTIQLYHNLLNPAFRLAVDDSLIRLNPCNGCMKEYVRGSMSSTKYPLSRKEQCALLDFIRSDSIYSCYYPLISFMLGTGCRVGETVGITWDDIDLEKKCVRINHQMIYKKRDGKIQFYSSVPKNKKLRIIPIQNGLVRILKKHKQETYFMSKSTNFSIDGYRDFVFINRENKINTPNTIVRICHEIRDAYNNTEKENAYFEARTELLLPDFSPHTLRHTFCTRMAENGIDIKVLQDIMGHSNLAVTMQIYNHVDTDRTMKEVSRLDDVLNL